MKKKFVFIVAVTFDTPEGFVIKRYKRTTFQKVLKLLESFDLLAVETVIKFELK